MTFTTRYTDAPYRAALKAARLDPAYATQSQDALKQYVEFLARADVGGSLTRSREIWTYPNPAALVLAQGKPYAGAGRPKGVRRMAYRQCFRNAHGLALTMPELTYTEGYGLPFSGIPCEHAWCVTADGQVVDPTWDAPDLASYYGVEIPLRTVSRLILRQRVYGILANDWRNDCAILRTGRIELLDDDEEETYAR